MAFIKEIQFYDSGDQISTKACPSVQPFIVGRLEDGPQLPVGAELANAE